MGATSSHPSSDEPPKRALHVLRVIPGSPASLAGIQVFFDFIVGIEGSAGQSAIDAQSLERIVESHEGRALNLIVWSSKLRSFRLVTIIPSRQWALDQSTSPSSPDAKPSLLGLSMRICEPEYALDNVWHILEILEGSPAESAGLVPYGDWIVGWSGGVLSKEGDFYDVVEQVGPRLLPAYFVALTNPFQHEEKPLRVYVYSYDFDTLREVVLVPNRMWGGEGLLGCGVGYGLLHRIPQVQAAPPEAEVDSEQGDEPEVVDGGRRESLFVPADEYPEYDASSVINGRLTPMVVAPQQSQQQLPAIVKTTPPELNLSDSPIPAISPSLPFPIRSSTSPVARPPQPARLPKASHPHSGSDDHHGHSHSHHDGHSHSHDHSHSHSPTAEQHQSHTHAPHDDHAGHSHFPSHSHTEAPPSGSRKASSPRPPNDHSIATTPSSARPSPPAAVTASIPISAPIPQKVHTPLSLASGSPPTPVARSPDPRLAEYRRRSATPDTLKDLAVGSSIFRTVSPHIGSPRLGSPRISSFGGPSGLGIGVGVDRKPSLAGLGAQKSSPTSSSNAGLGLGVSGAFGRKVAGAVHAPPADTDEENDVDGSEGEMRDGSITSVD